MNNFRIYLLVLLFFMNFTSSAFSMISKITTLQPLLTFVDDIVCSHDKPYFRETLFIFDLNKTFMIPDDDSLEYCFREKANLTNLLSMIKTDEFRAIVITDSKIGKYGVIGNMEDFIISNLESFDIDFERLCYSFAKAQEYFNGQHEKPLFKQGIFFYRNQSVGLAIVNFLKILNDTIKWQPKRIIFVNSSYSDLIMVKDRLVCWNEESKQSIKFYGFHFFASCTCRVCQNLNNQIDPSCVQTTSEIGIFQGDHLSKESLDSSVTGSKS